MPGIPPQVVFRLIYNYAQGPPECQDVNLFATSCIRDGGMLRTRDIVPDTLGRLQTSMSSYQDGRGCLQVEEALQRSICPSPVFPCAWTRSVSLFCDHSHHPTGWTQTLDMPLMHWSTTRQAGWCTEQGSAMAGNLANDPRKIDDLDKPHTCSLLCKAGAHRGERPGCHLASCFLFPGAGRTPALDRPRHMTSI